MQTYRYHGDTDEAPTGHTGNLSVSLMVGTPAVSAVLSRARCLSSIPFDLRYRRLRSGASWSGCAQKAQTSRGLTPVASENEEIKDLFRRRKGRLLGLRRQIGHPAQTRKLNVPFEVGIVSLIASKSIHASNCECRDKPLARRLKQVFRQTGTRAICTADRGVELQQIIARYFGCEFEAIVFS